MSFNSLDFLLFFPIVVLVYFIIPHKIRWIWLLLSSYYFYMSWNPKYALLMGTSTILTYICGILIEKEHQKNKDNSNTRKKVWMALCLLINLSILFFFKYFNFTTSSIANLFEALGIRTAPIRFDVLLPVGISFYTFQAIGYTIDVYRGDIKPEKNIFKYALFISFFPQLVAGPIERSVNFLPQISKTHRFNYRRVKNGLLLMLWGFFLKIVIADRAAIIVNQVFNNSSEYTGIAFILATLLFSIQIYCDFNSYSTIAVGAAQVLGFRLMTNFEEPYLSLSITEFWRRWHISLSTWFRDYLYIPLGGNRKGKTKKYRNTLIVFLVSGLWHGAGWTYFIWGLLHGIYQILEGVLLPFKKRMEERLKINTSVFSYKLANNIKTILLVNFAWIFFRADSLSQALTIIRKIFGDTDLRQLNLDYIYTLGMNEKNLFYLVIAMLVLLVVSICHYHDIHLRPLIEKQQLWLRWGIYYLIIFSILTFGVLGIAYETSPFIYFQF